MLMPLNKIADEIGVPESEAHRIAIYFGVPRRDGGLYEEREFLLAHIRYLRDKLFGFAVVEDAARPHKSAKRVRAMTRHKRTATPWAGTLLHR